VFLSHRALIILTSVLTFKTKTIPTHTKDYTHTYQRLLLLYIPTIIKDYTYLYQRLYPLLLKTILTRNKDYYTLYTNFCFKVHTQSPYPIYVLLFPKSIPAHTYYILIFVSKSIPKVHTLYTYFCFQSPYPHIHIIY